MAVRGAHIKVKDLTHRFTPKRPLTFDRVELEAQPGEALAIIGRSGCGKSTLLQIIAGLLHPTSGSIFINGTPIEGPSPRWVMMFQAPHLYPWMRVAQNVGIGLHFARRPIEETRTRVAEVLRLVGLEEYAENNVQDLSGGQQQRVALARSLVMEPEVLLLDEPFSALDAFTQTALLRDVHSIAKHRGFTLVMVTHSIDEAVLMSDRTLIMACSPGRIVQSVPIELDGPRELDNPSVLDARRRLMKCFEDAEAAAAASATTDVPGKEKGSGVSAEPGTKPNNIETIISSAEFFGSKQS